MNSQRLSEFEKYFQIDESNRVNLYIVDDNAVPKNLTQLDADIPPLFKLANEVSSLEQSALGPLRNFGDVAQELAVFLQAQSRKLDLIMSHVLASEQSEDKPL